jgi:ABC-2 type transport system permease protein
MTVITAPPRALPFGTEEVVFAGRSLRHALRNPQALVFSILLPVMLMLLFTFVFGGALDSSGSYVDYVVPGIILLCAGFGAGTTAVDVATDMATGLIDRLRTMPIRAWAVLTGDVLAGALRNIVSTAVVLCVAFLVGFRPTAGVGGWLAATGIVVAYIVAITALFAAIGLASRTPAAASSSGFVLLFLPYLSSAFVPVSTMPEWLRWIAEHQPLTPIIETIRRLLLGGELGATPWIALAWIVLIVAIAVLWSRVVFRRRAGTR